MLTESIWFTLRLCFVTPETRITTCTAYLLHAKHSARDLILSWCNPHVKFMSCFHRPCRNGFREVICPGWSWERLCCGAESWEVEGGQCCQQTEGRSCCRSRGRDPEVMGPADHGHRADPTVRAQSGCTQAHPYCLCSSLLLSALSSGRTLKTVSCSLFLFIFKINPH